MSDKSITLAHVRRKGFAENLAVRQILTARDLGNVCDGLFRTGLDAMCKLVESEDLFAKIPHGEGQTILREALLVADHNAYHLGELVLVRRLLGAWK